MRMCANDQIRARVNGELGELALVGSQVGKIFDAPMHKSNHEIGVRTCLCDVLLKVCFVQPGMAGSGSGGGKGGWLNLIVGKEGDGGSMHSFEDGRVCLLFVLSATNRSQATCGQRDQFIDKSLFPVVPTVVIR